LLARYGSNQYLFHYSKWQNETALENTGSPNYFNLPGMNEAMVNDKPGAWSELNYDL